VGSVEIIVRQQQRSRQMAANVVETPVEGATDVGAQGRKGRGHGIGAMGLAAAVLIAVLIVGMILHNRQAAHRTAAVTAPGGVSAAQYYDDLMSQQEDWIHTMAARATMRQAAAEYDDLMAQQDDALHAIAARADAGQTISSEQQRFLEENTILPGSVTAPYMEAVTPLPGQDR
jgi:hypothetical protein